MVMISSKYSNNEIVMCVMCDNNDNEIVMK
jgi:hypothetical protein